VCCRICDSFNDTVAVDIAFFEQVPMLKIIDFGSMKRILVDPGSENTSREFQEFCEARGIQLLTTAVQAPHSNGIVSADIWR